MNKIVLAFVTALAFLMTGCIGDIFNNALNQKEGVIIKDVPSDFDWSTVNAVQVAVQVNDLYQGQYDYTVKIFDRNPITEPDARLLAEGFARQGSDFSTSISVPAEVEAIAVVQVGPDELETVRMTEVAEEVVVDFSKQASVTAGSALLRSANFAFALPEYATVVPANAVAYSSGSWAASGSFYLPEGFNGTVNANSNTTFYIAGNATVSSFYFGQGSKLFLIPGAKATIQFSSNALGQSGCVVSVNANASLTTPSLEVGNGVQVSNKGAFKTNNYLKISSSGNFYNEGSLEVGGMLSGENESSVLSNYGTVSAQNFRLAGNSRLTNAGAFNVSNLIEINSNNAVFRHESGTIDTKDFSVSANNKNTYIACKMVVKQTMSLADCTVKFGVGAYTTCNNLTMNNTRVELANKAILKVDGVATYQYNPGSLSYGFYGTGSEDGLLLLKKAVNASGGNYIIHYGGNLQVENANHPAIAKDEWNKTYTIEPTVKWFGVNKSTLVVESSACSDGHLSPPVSAPKNPVFPMLVESGVTYTYALEDLWPEYGDYDMNDLVLELVPNYYLSSANKVSKLVLNAKLRAVGAQKKLAAAVQLDNIEAASVERVSTTSSEKALDGTVFALESSGLEVGQTKAVVPLFDNAHQLLDVERTMTNTVKGGKTASEVQVSIVVEFKSSATVNVSDIDVSKLNFFVVTNGVKTNRCEIHLRGYAATDRVNQTLFNTGVDQSTLAPYSSKDNMIWIMMIPDHFDYPTENANILKAYPDFKKWALSKGSNNKQWYKTPVASYLWSN